jgi:triacylglycerol esterase/lipase EstA (alpha/beta hydrolase family)
MILSFSTVSASACELPENDMQARPVNKNNFVTDYPYVFVHGMGGWGPSNQFYNHQLNA